MTYARDEQTADEPSDLAGQNPPVPRVRIFAIIGFALMMMALDGTIVATALEALTRGLDTTVNWASWTITVYAFGFVAEGAGSGLTLCTSPSKPDYNLQNVGRYGASSPLQVHRLRR